MKPKGFIALLVLSSLIVFGVIIDNISTVIRPKTSEVEVDVSSINAKIRRAGIIPRDAKYWKEL